MVSWKDRGKEGSGLEEETHEAFGIISGALGMEFQGPGFPRAYGLETNTANRKPLNKRALRASCKPGAALEPKARRSRRAPGAGVGGPPSGRKVGRRRRAGVSGARGRLLHQERPGCVS